jgi:small-conductance mechanosensitive channel
MAQTKRKRRTKHRGNAAGIVEHRGRTSRPPSPEERKKQQKRTARNARMDRYSKPPSLMSAANRALIVTVLFIAVLILVMKRPVSASIALGGFMLLLYIPIGYFTDSFFYKRRQQQIARGGGKQGR